MNKKEIKAAARKKFIADHQWEINEIKDLERRLKVLKKVFAVK